MLVIKCQIHYDIYKIKKLSGKSLGFYFNVGSIPTLATKNPMRNQTYPSDIGEG